MKKILLSLLAVLITVTLISCSSQNNNEQESNSNQESSAKQESVSSEQDSTENEKVIVSEDKKTVIIKVDSDKGESLEEYMKSLASEGLTFEIKDGMVTSINGVANTATSYWMLYTDDAEQSNDEWGTYDYNGKKHGSATVGAKELKIKKGCVYIWTYQTF